MRSCFLVALLGFILSTSVSLAQHTYSKAVQKAFAQDYKAHCGQYGIETDALRPAWTAQVKD
jgi:hypothetical protein